MPSTPLNKEELILDDISTHKGLVDAVHKFAKNLTQRSLDMDAMIKSYDMVESKKGEILTNLIESFVYAVVKTRENISFAHRAAALRETLERNWWVTNHDAPQDNQKVLGPFTTADDAAVARRYIELKDRADRNYWIEQFQSQPNAKEESDA